MKVWELLRNTFHDIGVFTFGKEDGGGASGVLWTDSSLDLTVDEEIDGILFVLSGTNKGDIRRVDDNAATTLTVAAMTGNNADGDYFAWQNEFEEAELLLLVNRAMEEIGDIPTKDTSITTADAQTEYTLPVAVKAGNIRKVEYQTNTGDANDNDWKFIPDWDIEPATAGNAGVLILPQLTAGRTVKIEYAGLHPELTAYTGDIQDEIHPSLAKAALKIAIANTRAEGAINSARGYNLGFNKAQDEFENAMRKHRVRLPEMKIRHLTFER